MNHLEEIIKEKALRRFDREFEKFTEAVSNNEIGEKLRIKTEEFDLSFVNAFGTTGGTFFNKHFQYITKHGKDKTNIQEIRKKLLDKYEKEEAESVMKRLDVLKDYLEGNEK